MATSDAGPVSRIESCPECNGQVTTDAAESVCAVCGLVLEADRIDHGKDWSMFSDGASDPERAMPGDRNFPDRGIGSRVGAPNERDADHRRLDIINHYKKGSHKDRLRGYATVEISRMVSALSLPQSVADRARWLFRRLHAQQSWESYNLDALAAACVYAACREGQQGLTNDEIADVSKDVTPSVVCKRLHLVCDRLDIQIPPPDTRQRIRVVASRLGVSPETRETALTRFDRLDDARAASASPSVVAAHCLYEAGEGTQRSVASAAGVVPASIRGFRDRI